MKKFVVVGLCILTLVGCGKAEIASSAKAKITSSCSLSGGGDAKCTFKNSGKVKGSACEYISLIRKAGVNIPMFKHLGDQDIKDARQKAVNATKKEGLVNTENELPYAITLAISNEDRIFSDGEVCSGIIEAGDIRQVTPTLSFLGMRPSQLCENAVGGWTDGCDFTTISKDEVVSMINAKLKE